MTSHVMFLQKHVNIFASGKITAYSVSEASTLPWVCFVIGIHDRCPGKCRSEMQKSLKISISRGPRMDCRIVLAAAVSPNQLLYHQSYMVKWPLFLHAPCSMIHAPYASDLVLKDLALEEPQMTIWSSMSRSWWRFIDVIEMIFWENPCRTMDRCKEYCKMEYCKETDSLKTTKFSTWLAIPLSRGSGKLAVNSTCLDYTAPVSGANELLRGPPSAALTWHTLVTRLTSASNEPSCGRFMSEELRDVPLH